MTKHTDEFHHGNVLPFSKPKGSLPASPPVVDQNPELRAIDARHEAFAVFAPTITDELSAMAGTPLAHVPNGWQTPFDCDYSIELFVPRNPDGIARPRLAPPPGPIAVVSAPDASLGRIAEAKRMYSENCGVAVAKVGAVVVPPPRTIERLSDRPVILVFQRSKVS